jgi:hypothetical protein
VVAVIPLIAVLNDELVVKVASANAGKAVKLVIAVISSIARFMGPIDVSWN